MEKTEVWRWNWTKPGFFPEIEEEENTNWEKEREKAPNWARLRWRWKFSPSGEKSGGKKENRKEEFLFFTFFTFLGNPPPKNLQIQNAAITPALPPWTPHHCAPHTMPYTVVVVLLWLDEFDENDWLPWIPKLSASPTSKPSCDRYTQPPKIKPTPPCSPDDVLHAYMNIMAS